MTRLDQPIVTTQRALDRARRIRDLCTALSTAAMLFSWAVAGHHYAVANEQPISVDREMERIMLAACRLPDVNGAITVFTMRDSKLECGRYK